MHRKGQKGLKHSWRSRLAGLAALALFGAGTAPVQAQTVLFQEGFEDGAFAARGWYDGGASVLSAAEQYAGARSLECRFGSGATTCPAPGRRLFPASESIYLSYYIRHSDTWVGSGRSYHPHMFMFVTNLDGAYVGPAYTHLTAYVEENGGVPVLAIQDARNIDEARVGQDLTNVTEQRAVAGCNGDADGYGAGDCYSVGALHRNGKQWRPAGVFFGEGPGTSTYKGDWHLVEAFFQLNGIANGKALRDGVLRYWYDGQLIVDRADVVMRTGANAGMKFNQLVVAPWIGDGSPVDQAYWIDDLTVATGRPLTPPASPRSAPLPPAPPTNLRIVP